MSRINQYKSQKIGFGNLQQRRLIQIGERQVCRKLLRNDAIESNRNLRAQINNLQCSSNNSAVSGSRNIKLKLYKETKSKDLQEKPKKPVFKVGIVHHRYYSPPPLPPQMNKLNNKNGQSYPLVSNCYSERLNRLIPEKYHNKIVVISSEDPVHDSRNNAVSQSAIESPFLRKLKFLHDTVTKCKQNSFIVENIEENISDKNIEMKKEFNSPVTLKSLTCSTEKSLNNKADFNLTPIQSNISKSSTEIKPVQIKLNCNLLPIESKNVNQSTKGDIKMNDTDVTKENKKNSPEYFESILKKEIYRLNELCNKWNNIKSEDNVSEDNQNYINQAIGQTQLLMNKKFNRFRELIQNYRNGDGEMLITGEDLQGFWDLMYIEIENCNNRFNTLEKLRNNNWQEEEIVIKNPVMKKKLIKKNKSPRKKNSIRAFILAAKQKKIAEINDQAKSTEKCKSPKIKTINSSTLEDHSINENLKSERKKSNSSKKRLSLLQQLQLSVASKSTTCGLTIMKLSRRTKTPKFDSSKSILSQTSSNSPLKQIKLYQNSPKKLEWVTDYSFCESFKSKTESSEMQQWLNSNSETIIEDCKDVTQPTDNSVKKKLNFEDEIGNNSVEPTPIRRRKKRLSNWMVSNEVDVSSPRILRSAKKTHVSNIITEENMSKENCTEKKNIARRKSSRKSVKFSVDTCTGCVNEYKVCSSPMKRIRNKGTPKRIADK